MEHKKISVGNIPNAIVLSKVDAAERQLRTAIWLWFHDFDPVPIHALAAASVKVLWRLHEKHHTGHRMMFEQIIDLVRPEYRKAWIEHANATENYIKHADKDPFESHKFNPEMTRFTIMDGVRGLHAFNAHYPDECSVFTTWFVAHYPHLLTLDDPAHVNVAKAAKLQAERVTKAEFYAASINAINANKARAGASAHP